MKLPAWSSSLRFRLLAATVAALIVALLLSGWALTALFRDHVTRQFELALQAQLDQLIARVEFDATGTPVVDISALSDPRWHRPYSGLYWQIDSVGRADSLRSRSLWDTTLALPPDPRADGSMRTHEGVGPQGRPLLMLARTIHPAGAPGAVWRVAVAGSTDGVEQAVLRFRGPLVSSLLALFVLLSLAAWAQVVVGLAPLNTMRRALDAVRSGRSARLAGRFPAEVQPLVDDFNDVLDRNAAVVERARQHAGNLAHALRTPLTVLRQSAEGLAEHARAGRRPIDATALSRLMLEQVDSARRHVDWHLARSRSAGTERMPGQSARVAPIVDGLVRVMQRVHAERGLRYDVGSIDDRWAVQGEEQDLQEMLGNLMDNACKWARTAVRVRAEPAAGGARRLLRIHVEDDGPGIAAEHLDAVLGRGARLDESVPGAGLGLAIVRDLAELHGGRLELRTLATGGLRATITLPAAGSAPPAHD